MCNTENCVRIVPYSFVATAERRNNTSRLLRVKSSLSDFTNNISFELFKGNY